MTKNKIFVVGREEIQPFIIVKEILSKSNAKSKEITKDTHCTSWTINNKYYKADVQFWIDSAKPEESTKKETEKHWKEIGNVIDAFIFVFDKYNSESFEDVKKWDEIISEFDINVKLCIGKSSDTKTETNKDILEKFYDDIENWTIENDFEYIDFENSEETEEGKNGVARIIEALETNMWENAVMKKGNEKDEEDEEKKLMEEVEDLRNRLFSKLDDDDGFDNLITNLKNLKEFGQKLPDEARRDLAAKVALSFEMEFGLDDEENDF